MNNYHRKVLIIMASTLDPNIYIKASASLCDFVNSIDNDDKPKSLLSLKPGKSELTLEDVKWIKQKLSESRLENESTPRFRQLIRSSEILLPQPKFAPRNPELEARIQRLKREQEEREYKQMIRGIDTPGMKTILDDEPVSKQMKELNNYLILIFQFVVSVVTAFCCGFFGPYLFYGYTDLGKRLLMGIIMGFVVGIADLYFILKFFLETEGVLELRAKAMKKEEAEYKEKLRMENAKKGKKLKSS